MKKALLFVAVVALSLSSCTTVKKTAKTMDVETSLNAASTADLVVSDNKISYEIRPKKKIRSGGLTNVKNFAVSEALRLNGNADVLVAPEFEVETRRLLLRTKIKRVVVTGYPATYKNFK